MGLRGPKPLPPEIKALKGNPGKRRLALTGAAGAGAVKHSRLAVEVPHYLTHKAERDAFNAALDTLPANVVRGSDVNALGRWACWLNIWVACKSSLNKAEKPDKFDHRRMSDAELHLARLENAIGLSPAARNAIVARLFAMPATPVVIKALEPAPDDESPSPLGWLQRAGKQFN